MNRIRRAHPIPPFIAALALAAVLTAPAAAQDAVRIGTSSVGSVFYTIAIGMSEIIQKHAKVSASVQPLGGSTANVIGIGNKKIEFAIANAFASYSGYYGRYNFEKPVDVRLVLQGQPSYRAFLVRKGANIRTPKDLEGKTVVGRRRALPEMELVMNAFIKVHGLDANAIKIVATTNTPEVNNAFKTGTIDAAIMPFSRKSPQIEEPARNGIFEFLYIDKAKQQEMLKILPAAFYGDTFEPNVFTGQTKPVHTVGMNTYLVTHTGVSDETVYKVVKAILENLDEFATYHRAGRQYNAKAALANVVLPFHNGAVRYFKEKGLWTPALESKQAELLKR